MLYTIFSTLASLAVATLLFSASLQIRFGSSELLVLHAPALVLGSCALLVNVIDRRYLVHRFKLALLFVLLACASLYSFVLGGLQESDILERILINCSLGFLITVYPWNRRTLSLLFLVIVACGCLLALSTLTTDDTFVSRRGYLDVTFAAAAASICALYRLVERIDPINIAAFALCWTGSALSLGREAFLLGVFVSLVYLFSAMSTRLFTMGRLKKMAVLALFVGTASLLFIQAMSIERTARRMAVPFGDAGFPADLGARTNLHELALSNFMEKPIVGHGLGAYLGDSISVGYPHNIVLQYLVDGGLIGGLVAIVFLAAIFRVLRLALLRGNPYSRNIILASGALYLFMVLSYLKAHDAYRGIEMFLLSAVPMAAYAALRFEASIPRHKLEPRRPPPGRLVPRRAGS